MRIPGTSAGEALFTFLEERIPSLQRALNMPFAHFLVWVYTTQGTSWSDGLSADE